MVTPKTDIMTTKTTQTLENQLVKLQNNVKFANHFEVVCKGQLKKESFSFTSLGMTDVNLFEEKIFSFSGLNLTLNAVNHFQEMFEICFDKKIDNQEWIQVIKSIKYVLKHINSDDNDMIAYNISNEIFNK